MSKLRFKNDIDERHQYRKQILLISKRLEIHAMKFDESIYERVLVVNKVDCDERTMCWPLVGVWTLILSHRDPGPDPVYDLTTYICSARPP